MKLVWLETSNLYEVSFGWFLSLRVGNFQKYFCKGQAIVDIRVIDETMQHLEFYVASLLY